MWGISGRCWLDMVRGPQLLQLLSICQKQLLWQMLLLLLLVVYVPFLWKMFLSHLGKEEALRTEVGPSAWLPLETKMAWGSLLKQGHYIQKQRRNSCGVFNFKMRFGPFFLQVNTSKFSSSKRPSNSIQSSVISPITHSRSVGSLLYVLCPHILSFVIFPCCFHYCKGSTAPVNPKLFTILLQSDY